MDEFLEKVKEYAAWAREESEKFGKQAYDRANSAIASVKLSFAINETEGKIKDCYQAIGKIVYNRYLADGIADESVFEACQSLDELFKEKVILKEKKAEIKKSVSCIECGEFNKADAVYCSKCGAKLSQTESDDTVEAAEPAKEEEEVLEKVVDKAEDIAEEIKDKAEDAAETVAEKAGEVAEAAAEKVKKVIKIKPKKSEEE